MWHWPLLQSIQDLDAFESVFLLVWTIVIFLGIGYGTDYLLSSQGMGPYWNAGYALFGCYAGLCLHDWWLSSFSAYEPELTICMIMAGFVTALLTGTAFAMR
jgi:hypothetical protein